jgi:gamma-glutamyltranspeptidase/glutathione hydrolase
MTFVMEETSRFSDERLLDRERVRQEPAYWVDQSPLGMVCTAHYRATEAGVRILEKGGNAIDAAAAASLALGVVEPAASGLGGMAVMLIHLADEKRTFLLEGPCRAPVKARPEAMGEDRRQGYGAVAVPTYPAVIGYAIDHYGTVSLADAAESAIELADTGHRVTPFHSRLVNTYRKSIRQGNAERFLLNEERNPPEIGTMKYNKPLANTLKRLAQHGVEEFYLGRIGQEILRDMEANNGFLSSDDFREIPWPLEVAPLEGRFRDYRVYTTPPPSGGFAVVEMIQIFDAWQDEGFDPDSPAGALVMAAIIRQARRDRRRLRLQLTPEWARFQPEILTREYASRMAHDLRSQVSDVGETTHLNVVDGLGNVVSLTQSIERSFGAKVASPELGFLYNGFMMGFKVRNKRHPHYLRPGAVARSNTAPTLLVDDRGRKCALGSTGSERMASGIFQVLVRLLSQSRFEAVKAPRLHCTPEGQVLYEPGRVDNAVLDTLKRHGLTPTPHPESWAFSAGGLHLAGDDGLLKWGVADPRRDGLAAAPRAIHES